MGVDDKAKVPLGTIAANKQQAILMRLDYKVKLPDHTFAVADKHKLIPSVYGLCNIDAGTFGKAKGVKYKGPTYIKIRSGKHDSSTTYDHGNDILSMYDDPHFKAHLFHANKPKPVLIIRTDGGPDQNIRHLSTIKMYYKLWKKLELDLLLISMSAPGCSAFNSIERRMAPLSRALVGLVIDHKKLGNHLDAKNKTKDEELERKNFAAAGKILAEVWNKLELDGYQVKASFVEPVEKKEKERDYDELDWKYLDTHVKFGHFHLSFMKCRDPNCCKEIKSNIHDVLQLDQYPAPRFYIRTKGIINLGKKFSIPPRNAHYSSIQELLALQLGFPHGLTMGDCHDDFNPLYTRLLLAQGQCRVCCKWYPSKKAMLLHRRAVHPRSRVNKLPDIPIEDDKDIEELLLESEIRFYDSIKKITDERDGQYLALLDDDTKSWVELPADHKLVIQYIATKPVEEEISIEVISDVNEWNLQDLIPDDDYKANQDDE